MQPKRSNFELYVDSFFEEYRTSRLAPVGAGSEDEETARDNGLDTQFWLTSRPDTYHLETGTKDTVILSPTSFELGLGTPDINIDLVKNFDVHGGDTIIAGDRSALADLPNRVAVVSTAEFFELFNKIGEASDQIVSDLFDGDVPELYAQLYGLAQLLVGQAFGDILVADLRDDGKLNDLVLFSYTDHINTRTLWNGRVEVIADTDAQVTVLDGAAEDQAEIEAMLAKNGFESVLNKDASLAELIEFQAPAFVEADFLEPGFFPSGLFDELA